MTRVCVVFGGKSSEYDVSLRSATCVLENLNPKKYEIVMVGISRTGRWFHYTGPVGLIATDQWINSPFIEPALISPDTSELGLLLLGERPTPSTQVRRRILEAVELPEKEAKGLRVIPLDVVFPVLHGTNGEDGTIQGLLQLSGIPYVGCGVFASAACMDKEYSHIILKYAGVNKTDLLAVRASDEGTLEEKAKSIESQLAYPVFVKPANQGSSVGVSKAQNRQELVKGMWLAFEYDCKIVVERTLVGREIECSVWGNENPHASHALGEIVPTREFYDYEGKYQDDSAGLIAPAELDTVTVERVREMAVKAYKAMDCCGLARVDFFVEEDGTPVLNEINTLPGFTSISMYPRLFQEDGVSIPELLDNLVDSAVKNK